jgi:UrcA family protein
MLKSKIGYLSAIAAGLFAATAMAGAADQWSDGTPSVTVRYGDLDLSSAQGRSMLYRRLSLAAQEVCPTVGAPGVGAIKQSNACQARAVKQAMRTIGGPMVARLASERGISLD